MGDFTIPVLRLKNQGILGPISTSPLDIVRHLGAVQAQDFAAAKWAVGLRLKAATDEAIEAAFDRGEILRTHVLRPTWHFVAPEDIRWMLQLTAPRVHAVSAFWYRKLELDAATFKRSEAAISDALRGGRHLTRAELAQVLQKAGIAADSNGHMTLLMIHAELEGVVCSGARKGKQHTYGLLEERVPKVKKLDRGAALAELTRRYFTGHGPATLQDYIWWSGLSAADAKNGLEAVKEQLVCETVGKSVYWWAPPESKPRKTSLAANLLPNFDEYTVGYTDRSPIFSEENAKKLGSRGSILFENTIVVNGQVIGTWKRDIKKDKVMVKLRPFSELTAEVRAGVEAAAHRYRQFLGCAAVLEGN